MIDICSRVRKADAHRTVHVQDLLLVVLITSAILIILFRLWSFHPRIPISYDGDGILTLSAFRNMQLHTGYMFSNLVGYPYGQHLQDFPAVGDAFCLSLSWILVKLLRDPVLAFNAFFLLTYPISAVGGYIGGRLLRIRRPTSIVIAVLYAFTPFHGMHGAPHLFLIMYPVLPVVIGLTVKEIGESSRFPGFRDLPKLVRGSFPFVVLGIAGGVSGLYYAFFTLLILFIGAALLVLQGDGVASTWRFIVGILSAAVALGLQFLPILWFQYQRGPNLNILRRGAFEVEYYSLRLIDLLLPIPQHPISAFATFTQNNTSAYIPGEGTAHLGLLGAFGVAVLLLSVVSRRRNENKQSGIETLSRIFIVLLVASGLGGINQILASVGFTQIRVWSRISIVLAFLALAAIGLVLDQFWRWAGLKSLTYSMLIAVVAIVGVWDTNRMIPRHAYGVLSENWHNDRRLISAVESQFGPGARILQLPILKFPEQGPIEQLSDYAQLRGQLHSRTLCWSYGVVIGRDGGRTSRWQVLEMPLLLQSARLQGFDAVWLELRAYPDNGAEIASQLKKQLGNEIVVDGHGLVKVFDLRSSSSKKRIECRP